MKCHKKEFTTSPHPPMTIQVPSPIGLPDDSGGMIGAQAAVGIPQYNTIVKYDLKGCSDQEALPYKHKRLMDAFIEAAYSEILFKFK